jgi:ankyrin repeat protein
MFDLLENAGASCRSVITNGGNNLLHWFCYNKLNDEHISLLKKLINKGCDINAENNLQRTPLMLAASLDMINTCHTLLNASADLEIVDYQGNCAIDLAPSDSECFRLLKQQRKRQINARGNPSIDRVLWRQKITSTHSLSPQINDSKNSFNNNDNHMEYYSANALETELSNEFDTKYKRMWDKLLHTKEKIRGSRESSVSRSRDRSQSRKKDPSQSRASDFFINLKL